MSEDDALFGYRLIGAFSADLPKTERNNRAGRLAGPFPMQADL